MIVAVAVGRPGINTMLVASQVVLSLILPFIIFPLVWLTSSRTVMRVRAPSPVPTQATQKEDGAEEGPTVEGKDEYVDYSNSWFTTSIGYIILAVIVIANGYVLVMLMLGKGT
jgi:metal iron transporter